MTPPYWQEATEYLSHRDPVMSSLIAAYPDEVLTNLNNPFHTLTRAVVGQQISIKAADKIWERLTVKLPIIKPDIFLSLTEPELREIGLSRQKISYITNIAQSFEQGILRPSQWETMTDEAIIKQLKKIKGIGQWTAEMFLIFHLHRSDILPLADLGLINAIERHYGGSSKAEIQELSFRWKPYRTVATWYLWRSLDPVVVQY
ncbi:DNA-3-methyladenine glycosylase 2 family protein [Spirulina subsalsa FACHB-351]|uniref:DNA-3-methyladenine glycosylase II n=1 Tax=Spirulina subsalsa FACHB-351 TaxID=234711 RepID=A0ABT3L427_9CYAN|nr:DNA-3-methyladenine glycosylase 2 family protein [Spirulina subsalsa]MCW6036266.1 DNA-3-methyladenine glycosylase 2 family protein [Spirulina subsalsa FACHB-351]